MAVLLLDLGNSRLKGGIFFGAECGVSASLEWGNTAPDYAAWCRRHFGSASVDRVVLSSVVPSETESVRAAARLVFRCEPEDFHPTQTAIELCCDNPSEVGADRVAALLGARQCFPDLSLNLLVWDCGTATTAAVLNTQNQFTGGLIAPGLGLSVLALTQRAALLKPLEIPILCPTKVLGTNSIDNIQSGVYYSLLGLMKEVTQRVTQVGAWRVVGTGGFGSLFLSEGVFDHYDPHLVLRGLAAYGG